MLYAILKRGALLPIAPVVCRLTMRAIAVWFKDTPVGSPRNERISSAGGAKNFSPRVRLSFNRARSMETKMRKRVLTVLGVLLIAALTIQMATAAARNAQKAAHAPVPAQELRERHVVPAPAAIHNRSCDKFWCYED